MTAMIFKFDSIDEAKDAIENRDIILSTEVFKQIKKAFYSKAKRKKVVVFSIQVNSNIIDFELDRNQWPQSLDTCLNVFSNNDMFEECIEIQKILSELN